jgi:hypothetical protein
MKGEGTRNIKHNYSYLPAFVSFIHSFLYKKGTPSWKSSDIFVLFTTRNTSIRTISILVCDLQFINLAYSNLNLFWADIQYNNSSRPIQWCLVRFKLSYVEVAVDHLNTMLPIPNSLIQKLTLLAQLFNTIHMLIFCNTYFREIRCTQAE